MKPRISVIIPLFNARPYLAEAFASMRAQNWPELEVIIIDDGSTDGSGEEAMRLWPEALLIRQSNQGPSIARNTGLRHATGKYLAFLDADDVWPIGKLERQVAMLESDPTIDASLGLIQHFRDDPLPGGGAERIWSRPYFLFLLGGMVSRPELFALLGGFDAKKFPFYGEDSDWFFRAWEASRRLECCEEATIFYRARSGSLTAGKDMAEKGLMKILKASLDRRRTDGGITPLPACFLRLAELSRLKIE